MTTTGTLLRGPADPDAFRIKVGRYKERWYHDPLPACDIAEATDESWPAATTVRNAWPKFLTAWASKAAATYAVDEQAAWRGLERDVAIAVISKEHERIRDRGGDRGSAVHSGLEAIAAGKPLDELVDHDIADWIPAMRRLIVDVAPIWVLTEAVAISRTGGFGGTLDAVWLINGRYYLIDFKSRAAGKVDDCYEDEGVQLGMYGAADYVIVDQGGTAVRRRLPELAGGLIVSIAPEGYRLFPVDLDAARHGAAATRTLWRVMANGNIVGKPVLLTNATAAVDQPAVQPEVEPAPVTTEPPAPLERRAWIIGCVQQIRDAGHLDDLAAIWPDGVPTFKATDGHSNTQLTAIHEACVTIGRRHQLPFFDPDPARAAVAIDDPRVVELVTAADALPTDLADKVGVDVDLGALRSGRLTTDELALAAIALTTAGVLHDERRGLLRKFREDFDDDTLFPALVRLATGQGAPRPMSRFTDLDVVRLGSLIAGIDAGVVSVAIADTGEVIVACTPTAEKTVVDRHGGKRPALEIAKAAARDLGLTVPRSVADVLADPILTALAAA